MKKIVHIFSKNAIYFLLIGIIGIFVFILFDLNKTVDHLSKDMVEKSLLRTNLELQNFFDPLKEDILITAQEHAVQDYNHTNFNHLNAEFRPLIINKRQVSSIVMATSEGDEFMILQTDTAWVFRSTEKGSADSLPKQYFWSVEAPNVMSSEKTVEKAYDPRERPWYVAAMNNPEYHINWTEPYTFLSLQEPGITISTRWVDTIADRSIVIALDVLLEDISEFTTETKVSENGILFILTQDERVIGLPSNSGYDSQDQIKEDILKHYNEVDVEQMTKTVDIWNTLDNKDSCFHFMAGDENWWASIEEYNISDEDKLLVGVVVPEKDFVSPVIASKKIIIVGFVLVLLFTIYILRAYREKNKSNDLLKEQKTKIEKMNETVLLAKHVIEEKKEEILDSINYAKRIQTAILPTDKYWKTNLPESFVLYMPKDIVAGDFYWMQVVGDEVLFAAADCTGHGVPGAMVSVVCHNALNRALREFGLHEPGEILNKVTDFVIETFAKSDHEVKDGMDIACCALHLKTLELEYAGAHNPLWILRAGNAEIDGMTKTLETDTKTLYEVKADKQPIGKFEYRQAFKNNVIQLQKGDTIYLSSDGYPDQFGGDKGKKLKSKAFKNLIVELSDRNIVDQGDLLQAKFTEWMGEFEQLDDVCVIGVKI